MRKLPPMLVVLLLLAILPTPSMEPREAAAQIVPDSTATVTEPLNLRDGASLADPVIAVMPAGATVTLTGQEIGDYVFVTWGREKGWAHRNWLDIRPPAPSAETAVTTDRLNLRSGPSLSDRVLLVLPKGATVTLTGQRANGFESVTYAGRSGWAFATYLGGTAPPSTPTGTAVTTDNLNLREGPSLSERVVTVMPAGAVVTLTGETRNSYRAVTWNGYGGWAHGDWLDIRTAPAPEPEPEPGPTSNATTTDNLNLRAGPATSFRVLTLIPRGATIVLTGETNGAFRSVSYDGFTGWAHGDWLVPEGAAPPPASTTTAVTTDRLNLRTGPATSYTVLVVMPEGATVTLTGQANNGFRSVRWSGYTGWAFEAFLDDGTDASPAPTPPPPPAPTVPPTADQAPFDVTNAIVGPARGSASEAIAFARRAGAQRMDEVERYIREVYRLGPQVGFDPAIIIAQSALETGYWRSDRWVQELNPAGLGISGGPGASQPGFASGTVAAHAQMAHMHAEVFGDSQPLPEILQGKDPTYQQVFRAGWAGTIRTIEDLSGTWAIDPEYHVKIVRVARELFA